MLLQLNLHIVLWISTFQWNLKVIFLVALLSANFYWYFQLGPWGPGRHAVEWKNWVVFTVTPSRTVGFSLVFSGCNLCHRNAHIIVFKEYMIPFLRLSRSAEWVRSKARVASGAADLLVGEPVPCVLTSTLHFRSLRKHIVTLCPAFP